MLVVQILGRLRVWRDGNEVDLGSQARRALLGVLALTPDKPVRRRALVDALWGEQPPVSAVNVLQTHVKHLRRILEPGRPARAASVVLPSAGDGYRLHLAGGDADVVRFRDLAGAAFRAAGNPARAVELTAAALAQWHGPVLSDVPLLARLPAVTRLTDERRRLLALHAELLINLGRAREVLTALAEDADHHPLDEPVHALLVRAYAATGQRARAAQTYHAMRDRLADELGVAPGVTLRSAYEQVVGPDRTPAAGGSPGTRRGAVPRQLPAEVADFAGRADELRQLDTAGPLILLCGTPGVGKTALAVRWAHRARTRFPDGQLFVDLRGFDAGRELSPGEALALLLSMLGVPDGDIPTDPQHRMARFRSAVADRRMLILLDNANSVEQVRPLLPGTASCTVMITSRAHALNTARDTFRDLGQRVGEASALANLGEVLTRLGRHQRASTVLDEALALFRRTGHRDGEATALSNLATVNTHLGAFDTAVRQSRAALAIFQASGHQYGQASVLNVLGSALLSMGSREQARHHYTEALTIARATGDTDETARATAGIAMTRTAD